MQSLPVEIVFEIFGYLSVKDLSSLMRVNKYFSKLARSDCLWSYPLYRDFRKVSVNPYISYCHHMDTSYIYLLKLDHEIQIHHKYETAVTALTDLLAYHCLLIHPCWDRYREKFGNFRLHDLSRRPDGDQILAIIKEDTLKEALIVNSDVWKGAGRYIQKHRVIY